MAAGQDDARTAAGGQARPGGAAQTAPPTGLPLGRLVLGALLVLLGVLWLLDAAGIAELRWRVVLPAVLTVIGVALLASARRGAHGGLVAAGIILTVLVLLSAATPAPLPIGGVGDVVERPATVADAEQEHSLAVGSLTVDLRDLEVTDAAVTVSASVGIGELVVRLPAEAGAVVEASAGIGEVTALDRTQGGLGVSLSEQLTGEPMLELELSVGIGRVEVRR